MNEQQTLIQAELEQSHTLYTVEIVSTAPHLKNGVLVVFDVTPRQDMKSHLSPYQRVAFFKRSDGKLRREWDMIA